MRDAGLPVRDVSELTGFPEMMDGRVKTLHPKVHGGLLGRAGTDDAVMAEHGIAPIDLLVLNLYPFEKVSAIPTALRRHRSRTSTSAARRCCAAAAKNFARVAVATDPAQYAGLLAELDANDGACPRKRASRWRWPRSTRRAIRRLHQQLPVRRCRTTAAWRCSPAQATAISSR
jgi:phosphoribosylaminoimidazolecarboxamide formyltransferase/IMP cyclohydrolase